MAVPLLPVLNFGASALLNLAGRARGIDDRLGTLVGTPESVLSARGVFYRVELYPNMGRPMYAIDELNRLVAKPVPYPKASAQQSYQEVAYGIPSDQNQYFLDSNAASAEAVDDALADLALSQDIWDRAPILITGIQLIQSDVVSAVPCLDNFKAFYTFGQNFGQVAITGEMLLGPHGEFQQVGISHLTNFFANWRVSQSGRAIKLSVVNKAFLVYLTGLQLGVINPEFHILPFTLTGVLIDPENEKSGTLNQAGVVANNRNNLPALLNAIRAYPGPDLQVSQTTSSSGNTAATKSNTATSGTFSSTDITNSYVDPITGKQMVVSETIGKAVEFDLYRAVDEPGITPEVRQARLNALMGTTASANKEKLTDTQIDTDSRFEAELTEEEKVVADKVKKEREDIYSMWGPEAGDALIRKFGTPKL